MVFSIVLIAFTSAHAINFTVGRDGFYLNVGDYDYLPLSYQYGGNGYNNGYNGGYNGGYNNNGGGYGSPISFQNVLGQYGTWVYMQPFGQVWQPYVDSASWRPYTYGHWIYTSYGPTWQGYEPWAWAAYHYGNWVYSQQNGWVWVPGYDWHPGRVQWAQGYDSIGWTPAPPQGYDYSRGYLSYNPNYNQYSYSDQGFGYGGYDNGYGNGYGNGYNNNGYGNGYNNGYNNGYSYGGPYYDSHYRNSFYNNSYLNLVPSLWTFIARSFFSQDNYADYYLGPDYNRNVFSNRIVQLYSQPIQKPLLERLVGAQIREIPVTERQIQTDKKAIKVIVPQGEEDMVRKNAARTVNEVLAPSFAKHQRAFKGTQAKSAPALEKVFRQDNKNPRVETVDQTVVVRHAQEQRQVHEQKRQQIVKEEVAKIDTAKREGKIHEARSDKNDKGTNNPNRDRQLNPDNNGNDVNKGQKTQDLNNGQQSDRIKKDQQAADQKRKDQEAIDKTDKRNRDQQELDRVRRNQNEKPAEDPNLDHLNRNQNERTGRPNQDTNVDNSDQNNPDRTRNQDQIDQENRKRNQDQIDQNGNQDQVDQDNRNRDQQDQVDQENPKKQDQTADKNDKNQKDKKSKNNKDKNKDKNKDHNPDHP